MSGSPQVYVYRKYATQRPRPTLGLWFLLFHNSPAAYIQNQLNKMLTINPRLSLATQDDISDLEKDLHSVKTLNGYTRQEHAATLVELNQTKAQLNQTQERLKLVEARLEGVERDLQSIKAEFKSAMKDGK